VAVSLTALMWLGLMAPGLAESGSPLEPFEAGFTAYRYGIPIGEVALTLIDEGGGRYSMRSGVRPSGPVSLIVSVEIDERVVGELEDDIPHPVSYRRQQTGDKERQVTLAFDWDGQTVSANKDGRETTLALRSRVVDPLSFYLLTMLDLKNGRSPDAYTLVMGNRLKTYQVRRHGEEILETPLGKLATVRIGRQRQGSSRVTAFWYAPDLGFLPVQVANIEDGEVVLRLTIRNLKRIGAPLEGVEAR